MASSSSVNLVPAGRFSPSVLLLLPASGSAALLSALLSEHFTGSELPPEGFVTDMLTGR